MQRGALSQSEADFLGVWIPKRISKLINAAVNLDDTDRSKFVRAAIREKLTRRIKRTQELQEAASGHN